MREWGSCSNVLFLEGPLLAETSVLESPQNGSEIGWCQAKVSEETTGNTEQNFKASSEPLRARI